MLLLKTTVMCPCFVMSDFIVILLGQVGLKLYYGYWFVHSLLEFGIRWGLCATALLRCWCRWPVWLTTEIVRIVLVDFCVWQVEMLQHWSWPLNRLCVNVTVLSFLGPMWRSALAYTISKANAHGFVIDKVCEHLQALFQSGTAERYINMILSHSSHLLLLSWEHLIWPWWLGAWSTFTRHTKAKWRAWMWCMAGWKVSRHELIW